MEMKRRSIRIEEELLWDLKEEGERRAKVEGVHEFSLGLVIRAILIERYGQSTEQYDAELAALKKRAAKRRRGRPKHAGMA